MINAIFNGVVEVESRLYNAGRTEDGFDFAAESFFVQVTFPNGQRFAHNFSFNGCVVHWNHMDGCNVFEDVRPAARAAAERLAARVREASIFDDQYWREVDPVYGSEAYQSQGIEHQRWLEDRDPVRAERHWH